jgi:hypothetical protein
VFWVFEEPFRGQGPLVASVNFFLYILSLPLGIPVHDEVKEVLDK